MSPIPPVHSARKRTHRNTLSIQASTKSIAPLVQTWTRGAMQYEKSGDQPSTAMCVLFGSTWMPGPMVVERVIFLR